MKIFVIAALHGEEVFGLKVLGRIRRGGKNEMSVMVGHPEAVAKRRRCIDEDLNRSFNTKKDIVERMVAQHIKQEIEKFAPDLIIDIHTAHGYIGKVAIVAERSPLTDNIAKSLGMEVLVIMPKHLTDTSLIGCFPSKSISLELGKNHRSDKLALEIAEGIESLNFSSQNLTVDLPTFEVYGEISKGDRGLAKIKNLVFNKRLGGYPFLAGPNVYESIGGFLARKIS